MSALCRLFPVLAAVLVGAAPVAPLEGIPRFAHVIVIVEEDKSYDRIVGSELAPRISQLAQTYGSATAMYGEDHPSEGNYIAMIAGSTFGVNDDGVHHFDHPSLPDQLRAAGLDWRGYFGSLPQAGSTAVFSPAAAGAPEALYASKHNPFVNFDRLRTAPDFATHTVGLDRFATDLAAGAVPAFAFVVPNQCDEMHGLSALAVNVPKDCHGPAVIARGDRVAGELVDRIVASPLWRANENAAIVVTFDEDDGSTRGAQGCCGFDAASPANFGGGHIPTVVITNHGPRGVSDPTPYNHYSLLRTIEDAFGISRYLELADATARGVHPMRPLFAK
ncbi:MAG: phosphatidylinositol-3-phosphatase [Candidatus Velthaea sp.]